MTIAAERAFHEDEVARYKEALTATYNRNKELQRKLAKDESKMPIERGKLLPDYRPHPQQLSELARRCFATNVLKFIAP